MTGCAQLQDLFPGSDKFVVVPCSLDRSDRPPSPSSTPHCLDLGGAAGIRGITSTSMRAASTRAWLQTASARSGPSTVPRADVPDLGERLERYVPEHVQCACAHWVAHLGDACGLGKKHGGGSVCGCRELGERLATFARTKLGAWVEMMAYMRRLDMVTVAFETARTYLKVRVPSVVVEYTDVRGCYCSL